MPHKTVRGTTNPARAQSQSLASPMEWWCFASESKFPSYLQVISSENPIRKPLFRWHISGDRPCESWPWFVQFSPGLPGVCFECHCSDFASVSGAIAQPAPSPTDKFPVAHLLAWSHAQREPSCRSALPCQTRTEPLYSFAALIVPLSP